MPYINKFKGKTVVIKYGGSVMLDEKIKYSIIGDIVFMKMIGINPIIVHGGGPAINDALKLVNIEPKFQNGIRVTDKNTIKIVESVLFGTINKSIVSTFEKYNVKAIGISGKDNFLIEAAKKTLNNKDIGYVGDITRINTQIIENLIANGFIPVISPIGTDSNANTYNINADHAALEIAIALKAAKLIFLTDIEGIRKNLNDPSTLISKISPKEIENLIVDGSISNGMIPKVECCIKAIQSGINSVHIISGKIQHSILLEIYKKNIIGTVIEK